MRVAIEDWSPAPVAFGDERDAVFATSVDAPSHGTLRFDGIATLATIMVDGNPVAESSSMWVPVEVPITPGRHDIEVRCHALAPHLAVARKPRARWRQKVAYDNNLRWFRTSLNGRAPGFAPGPPVVGLWRPAWFVADEPKVVVRTRIEGSDGVVTVASDLPDGSLIAIGEISATTVEGRAELRLPSPRLWWPHTHGEQHLYEVTVDGHDFKRRVGFRTIESPRDILRDGLQLRLNGVDLFVRGALWTPVPEGEMRATLETARNHGLNAVRIPGTMNYETSEFHDLCDELGILVWQDLMFANFDYPFSDPHFRVLVDREVAALLEIIGGRPSLFCICGGSEIEQQAEMLGLDRAIGRSTFFAEDMPAALAQADIDSLYVPSAPCGADRALLPGQGVSNWFGVGGYRRPLSDVRSAGVRFASECLALANVGDDVPHPNDPAWKDGVPGDVGEDWDFDDVRDHYMAALYGVDAKQLRSTDPDRYLDLSRRVSGDVMAEVFGEWRRSQSGCGGAFVLWLRDLRRGPGWGLIDSAGAPKPVLRSLCEVLAPVAIWMTDEGMGGYAVHVANDGPDSLEATVSISLSCEGRHVDGGAAAISVSPRSSWSEDAETIVGRWADIAYTYRFGPPAHDLVTAELRTKDGVLIGTARRYPLGRAVAA